MKTKLQTRNNLIRKLAGTTWGANAVCFRTSALSLLYSTVEYCCSSWLNSTHVSKIDTQLKTSMRIISGTLKPTVTIWLPGIWDIKPPDLRRKEALLRDYGKIIKK